MNVVVIPCFRVRNHILDLLARIGPEVDHIIVVDDKCPEESGRLVQERTVDPRVEVIFHAVNQGVGGAMATGMAKALERGATYVLKLDGDGQMDPALIPQFLKPLVSGAADYTKGNRFAMPGSLRAMPRVRLFGNAVLSFINKFVTGYWTVFDPTNGYLAINAKVLAQIPLEKLHKRYFFEADMLHHLSLIRAVVVDIPMRAVYADEKSSMRISRIISSFPPLYVQRFLRRILYWYVLQDFTVGTIYIFFGTLLTLLGVSVGTIYWMESVRTGVPATSGSVMLAALPTLLGIQFLMSAIQFDISMQPRAPLSGRLEL